MKPTTDVVEVPRFDFLPRPRRLTQKGETRLDARVKLETSNGDAAAQRFPSHTIDEVHEHRLQRDAVERIVRVRLTHLLGTFAWPLPKTLGGLPCGL